MMTNAVIIRRPAARNDKHETISPSGLFLGIESAGLQMRERYWRLHRVVGRVTPAQRLALESKFLAATNRLTL
jgi:hypothetical protein